MYPVAERTMNGNQFRQWTRRGLTLLASSGVATVFALRQPASSVMPLDVIGQAADAKRRHRTHKKKLQRNAFGCVDVGKACRGDDTNCCSGICDGNKPKKGKKDRSRCVAHNTGGCQPDQDFCLTAQPCGTGGFCTRTTGAAGFCLMPATGVCADCTKDTDCEAVLGPGAACVVTCSAGLPCTGEETICLAPAA
jgi:hypothetical protein